MADNTNTGNTGGQTGGNPGNLNRPNPGPSGMSQGGDRRFTETAKDTAHSVAERVSEVAGQAREKAGEWAEDAYGAARDAGRRVQRWAGDAYDAAADRVEDFGTEVTGLIRRHPIPAILIGFGVGLLLGRAARMV
jgi:ElaB/YqjD/DUF883 family membrane-anchored ribosome-binding protein